MRPARARLSLEERREATAFGRVERAFLTSDDEAFSAAAARWFPHAESVARLDVYAQVESMLDDAP